MDWKDLPTGNVEDRRGGGGLPGGGVAIGGVGALVLALLGMFFGFDPSSILGGGDSQSQTQGQTQSQTGQTQSGQSQGSSAQPSDEVGQFVSRILGSTNQTWTEIFQKAGKTYTKPKLVLYSGSTHSGCGTANSAVGPFYCPNDSQVYLDTSFFNQMKQQLGGGGDFAYAYVIAHEVGHHVQNELDIAAKADRAQQSAPSEAAANQISVRVELQADCFAGVWGKDSSQFTHVTQQDVQEAINTAQAIGDDNLQKQGRGYVVPDSFTHGTAQQRVKWFMTGFESGDPNKCDTFAGSYANL